MKYIVELPSLKKGKKNYWKDEGCVYYPIHGCNPNKAARFDTEDEARKALAAGIRDGRRTIRELKKEIEERDSRYASEWFNKEAIQRRIDDTTKNIERLKQATIVEFRGDIRADKRYRGKIKWESEDPFTQHCSCCGFIIPVRSFLRTTSYQHLCPVCIARAAEQSKVLLEQFEREDPELYNKMINEMFLSEL